MLAREGRWWPRSPVPTACLSVSGLSDKPCHPMQWHSRPLQQHPLPKYHTHKKSFCLACHSLMWQKLQIQILAPCRSTDGGGGGGQSVGMVPRDSTSSSREQGLFSLQEECTMLNLLTKAGGGAWKGWHWCHPPPAQRHRCSWQDAKS